MSERFDGGSAPPHKRTAVPAVSKGDGANKKISYRKNYTAISLFDKAALAAEIAADGELRGSDKVVAFALLFRFQNTKSGQCNPSYKRLAAACCLERRTVIKATHRLEMFGYLKVDRTAGGRNRRNQFWFAPIDLE